MAPLDRVRPRWMHWFRDYSGHQREGSPRMGKDLVYLAIDSGQNDKLIVFVAALGFFVDSYILFATNVINPSLGYVYWKGNTHLHHEFSITAATLCGCIFGMLLFGWLGDQFGRRKVYGWELLVLMIGTTGVVMSSPGYVAPYADGSVPDWGTAGSMNVYAWLLWWRFVTGVGIGGDYPLSSVLVAEFSPTRRRAWMLSLVFSMQALGYATASVVSLIVVACVRANQGDPLISGSDASHLTSQQLSRSVDQIWRWIMGLALFPGLIAMILRLNIPESPRYVLDVDRNIEKAFEETNRFKHAGLDPVWANALQIEELNNSSGSSTGPAGTKEVANVETRPVVSDESFMEYLFGGPWMWYQRNWTILAGTALTWFALDLGFFALSLNSPSTVAKIWWFQSNGTILNPLTVIPPWNTKFDLQDPDPHIYDILMMDNWQSLVTTSIGAIVGSIVMFLTLWRWKINQKQWQIISFAILTALFIITGASYVKTVNTSNHTATVVLYILCAFFFYFGPNTLTFIIAAQLFPTKYRATCAGISAAAGKLGSVIVQAFLAYAKINGQSANDVVDTDGPSKWLGYALMVFSLPMLIGAIVTKFWVPDLQKKNGENYTLEELVRVKENDLRSVSAEEDEE